LPKAFPVNSTGYELIVVLITAGLDIGTDADDWAEYQLVMETKKDRLFPKRSPCAGNGTIIEPILPI